MKAETLGTTGMFKAWEERALDPRPRIRTGWSGLDEMFHRGGIAPGELVILAGRTHTRKTTVMLNMMSNMLQSGTRVGFIALDETAAGYTSKLTSCITGVPMQTLEYPWPDRETVREEAKAVMAGKFAAWVKPRPSFEGLTSWVEDSAPLDLDSGKPEVVFIDYLSLLGRDKFAGQEVQRIQRLVEDLQVWTADMGVVTVALHQVGRMDEGTSRRYHGDTPLSLESLKFGGEEIADIVLGTYRPELNPVGNMTPQEAEAALGDRYKYEDWETANLRVKQHKDTTFLQLLKNRPGVHLLQKGLMLRSPSESMAMVPAAIDTANDGKVVQFRGA